MNHDLLEQSSVVQLQAAVRLYRRIAIVFATLAVGAGIAAFMGREGSNMRWLSILTTAWAALTALSFLLTANAYAEDAPIRRFVRRFAFGCAAMPPLLWVIGRESEDVGAMLLAGIVVLFFGWRALRHVVF
jgi:hypothetical protein